MKTSKPRGNPNWKKDGPSPNPGGRKAIDPGVKEALEALNPRAVSRLGELMESGDHDVALKAVLAVLDRNLGKVKDSHDVNFTGSIATMDLAQLLRQLPEALRVLSDE